MNSNFQLSKYPEFDKLMQKELARLFDESKKKENQITLPGGLNEDFTCYTMDF